MMRDADDTGVEGHYYYPWSSEPQYEGNNPNSLPISSPDVTFGFVTFRTYFDPYVTGVTEVHCHVLTHEDVGVMQEIEIK